MNPEPSENENDNAAEQEQQTPTPPPRPKIRDLLPAKDPMGGMPPTGQPN